MAVIWCVFFESVANDFIIAYKLIDFLILFFNFSLLCCK